MLTSQNLSFCTLAPRPARAIFVPPTYYDASKLKPTLTRNLILESDDILWGNYLNNNGTISSFWTNVALVR